MLSVICLFTFYDWSSGISRSHITAWLDDLPVSNQKAVFKNKAPLRPITSRHPMGRMQADLVDLGKELQIDGRRYVLVMLDVYSRCVSWKNEQAVPWNQSVMSFSYHILPYIMRSHGQHLSVICPHFRKKKCSLHRFIWLRSLQGKTPKGVAKEMRAVFLEFGSPGILQTDNGGEFKGVVDEVLTEMGIKHIRSRPNHPQSQGKVGISGIGINFSQWEKEMWQP